MPQTLSAASISLLASGSVSLNGRIIATSGALDIDATGSVRVYGTFASGSDANNAEAALALLQSPASIRVTAGSSILLGERSQLQTTRPTRRTQASSASPPESTPSSPATCFPPVPC
ncbi:MAG UNVERIFIED_CONTAM: hypothetical protein LVR18_35220 [Planctomycetaceae bacterium]|jgi:hypothetical protein